MKKIVFLIISCTFLFSCDAFNESEPESHSNKFSHSILSFGTVIDVTLLDTNQQTAEQVFKTLENDFAYWHRVWNPWQKGPLARVNTLIPTKAAFNLPLHLIPIIKQSQTLFQQSEGLYNPAIGHLINLWHFTNIKTRISSHLLQMK